MSSNKTTNTNTKKTTQEIANTNIAVSRKLWNDLKKIGSKGESFDSIIRRLYDSYKAVGGGGGK